MAVLGRGSTSLMSRPRADLPLRLITALRSTGSVISRRDGERVEHQGQPNASAPVHLGRSRSCGIVGSHRQRPGHFPRDLRTYVDRRAHVPFSIPGGDVNRDDAGQGAGKPAPKAAVRSSRERPAAQPFTSRTLPASSFLSARLGQREPEQLAGRRATLQIAVERKPSSSLHVGRPSSPTTSSCAASRDNGPSRRPALPPAGTDHTRSRPGARTRTREPGSRCGRLDGRRPHREQACIRANRW